eukprot:TRINITY_DN4929_c0_g2_i1.p1 TRINITY_DN4929_c0_g2~~TRINITY_DN4929_c0_g2_i1.p1  ORF type:complete len:1295 (-),score=275.79 TRINITY_DN4929_c0_g2_i1:35-3886(-)
MASNINLNIFDPSESVCAKYHQTFSSTEKVNVKQAHIEDLTECDCIVVPMPTAFGIASENSCMGEILSVLGTDFLRRLRNSIKRKFFGEQPLGTAVIIRVALPNIRYAAVVPLFRASVAKGNELDWLDPGKIPLDYAYIAMRAALLRILHHNASGPKHVINNIYCPDFYALRKEAVSNDPLGPIDFTSCISQMLFAIRGLIEKSFVKPVSVDEAILLQREILQVADKGLEGDLEELLMSGSLENRGLYNEDELETVMSYVRGNDPEKKIRAARVLASCITRDDTQFRIPKKSVANSISHKDNGCFNYMMELVIEGSVQVHREIPIDELEIGPEIGEGTAGSVNKGTWRGKPVAVKRFRVGISQEHFLKELSTLCLIQHERLVKCYGGVTQDDCMMIILELMHVSLGEILECKVEMDLGTKIRIAQDVAEGMEYLHSHCNLVHRDLKSMNLLVKVYDGSFIVKICDFGVSRLVDPKKMTNNVGTISWIAPEIFRRTKYNHKADVYSFGIILWEIFTGKIPFEKLSTFSIPVSVQKGVRPIIPKKCPKHYKQLIQNCWRGQPKKRPNFDKIQKALERMYNNLPTEEKQQKVLDIGNVVDLLYYSSNMTLSISQSVEMSGASRYAREQISSDENVYNEFSDSSYEEESEESKNLTVTCIVPEQWARPMAELENEINGYFSGLNQNLDMGSITVSGDRYILFRAHSIGYEFEKMIQGMSNFTTKEEGLEFSQNFLYDLGHSLGKTDAQQFLNNIDIDDNHTLKSAGLITMAYSGIAYSKLLPDTNYSDIARDEYALIENLYSFEAASYLEKSEYTERCTCVLAAGYIAGWGEGATGVSQACVELQCKARRDERCLFIRTVPRKLDHRARQYCIENEIDYPGLPVFLRNRKDTNPNYIPPTVYTNEKNWFQKSWNKVFKKDRKKEVSGRSKNISKLGKGSTLTFQEIYDRSSEMMSQFFITPTEGTVEIADEKCILIRGDSLGIGFVNLVSGLFGDEDVLHLQFASTFLFNLGKSMGISNHGWLTSQLGIGKNPMDQCNALSVSMIYFGWSNLKFPEGLHAKRISKQKQSFLIRCECKGSFEASSWKTKDKNVRSKVDKPTCNMHCGYICGWFERSLGVSVSVVEVQCQSLGSSVCEFLVSPPEAIGKYLPRDVDEIDIASRQDTDSVYTLMNRFRKSRSTSAAGGSFRRMMSQSDSNKWISDNEKNVNRRRRTNDGIPKKKKNKKARDRVANLTSNSSNDIFSESRRRRRKKFGTTRISSDSSQGSMEAKGGSVRSRRSKRRASLQM